MKITVYHGTSATDASTICGGGIDVSVGGGELGRGFYTGEFLHEARTWAFHRNPAGRPLVVELTLEDADFFAMDPLCLTAAQAVAYRNNIRSNDSTRTYLFDEDIVWSQIVGTDRIKCDQYKWESNDAEDFLNGSSVSRTMRK